MREGNQRWLVVPMPAEVLATAGQGLDAQGRARLKDDVAKPVVKRVRKVAAKTPAEGGAKDGE